jgi:hypothetical protein
MANDEDQQTISTPAIDIVTSMFDVDVLTL